MQPDKPLKNIEVKTIIKYVDTTEYLRFVDINLYEKMRIATKDYKDNNRSNYDDFIENNIIKSTKGKYVLERYLKEQYALSNESLSNIGYKQLLKNNITPDMKNFFIVKQIHDKLKIYINLDSKIKGI